MTCAGFFATFWMHRLGYIEPLSWINHAYFYKFRLSAPRWMLTRYFSHPLVVGNVAVISTRKRDDAHRNVMIEHALAHVDQWMLFGMFMPIVRLAIFLFLCCLPNADKFFDNPFEIDARRRARQTVDVPHVRQKVLALVRDSGRKN